MNTSQIYTVLYIFLAMYMHWFFLQCGMPSLNGWYFWIIIKGLFTWKWGDPREARNTCLHLVAKHAHKQRTIVCYDVATFCNNIVVAGKTLVWFCWLAWLSDSTLKLLPALSTSSAFWWSTKKEILVTPPAWGPPLPCEQALTTCKQYKFSRPEKMH